MSNNRILIAAKFTLPLLVLMTLAATARAKKPRTAGRYRAAINWQTTQVYLGGILNATKAKHRYTAARGLPEKPDLSRSRTLRARSLQVSSENAVALAMPHLPDRFPRESGAR
jgi:hypothetical protein